MGGIDFGKTMARLPEEELYRIANPSPDDDFVDAAVAAAQAEIRRRELPETAELETLDSINEARSRHADYSREPLSNFGFVAFVLFGPMLFFSLGGVLILWGMGRARKAKEALQAILAGWAFYGLLAIVLVFFVHR